MPDAIDTAQPPVGRALYEADEHEWIAAQVAALAHGRLDRLDRANATLPRTVAQALAVDPPEPPPRRR